MSALMYKVGVFRGYKGTQYLKTVYTYREAESNEETVVFIRWLSDWVEVTV